MKKRQLIIIGSTILIFVLGYVGMKLLAAQKKPPQKKESTQASRSVRTRVVENDTMALVIPIWGNLVAGRRLEVFSEVTGKLLSTAHPFKVGIKFNQGDVLLAIDGQESLLNLKSQRSSFMNLIAQLLPDIKIDYESEYDEWNAYLTIINPEERLPEIPNVADSKLKNLLSTRSIYAQYYAIRSLENRQEKFTITAPFNGTIIAGDLNPGSLIRAGQKMGELISEQGYELQASLPLSDASKVDLGDIVMLDNGVEGKITRISINADPNTQQVKVYVTLDKNNFTEGAYLESKIMADYIPDVIEVDRNMILDDNRMYFIEDSLLRIRPIQVLHYYKDAALVKGFSNGELILDQVIQGAHDGMKVDPIAAD